MTGAAPPARATVRPAWGIWLARAGASAAVALYAAGPLWSVAQAPPGSALVWMALAACSLVAVFRPTWSPALLLGVVPLLPVWPTLAPWVPPAIVHLLVATQVVPWLLRRAWGRPPASTCPAVPAWGVFVAVAAVSMLSALAPARLTMAELAHVGRNLAAQVPGYVFLPDAAGDARAIPLFTGLFDGLCCAVLVGGVMTRDTRVVALRAAAAGAVLTALFGFYQAATGLGLQTAWRIFDAGIVRINATYVDPNALAAFYALTGPVLIGLAMGTRGARRAAWALGFAIVLAAVVMTAGRAGLVSLACGCAALAWLGGRLHLDDVDPSPAVRRYARRATRGLALTLAGTLLALCVAGTALDVRHAQQTSYVHTWLYTFNLRQPPDAIAKGRLAVWQAVGAMIRSAPIAGLGLGQSVSEFERFRSRLGIESLPADAQLSAHNTYLLVTSELGVVGLSAWLLMLVGVAIGAAAPGNLTPRQQATWPTAGLVAGLTGYTLTMLTGDRILLREDVVVGTMCAALATLGAGRLPRPWRVAAWVVVALAFAVAPLRVARPQATTAGVALPAHEGLHGEQVGVRGDVYRWTRGYAVLYLPEDAVRVQVPIRNLSPGAQRVEVFVDGRPADVRDLDPGTWATLDYRLPPVGATRWHRVALQVTPTWQAPGDPRVLGVVLGEWTVERRP